MVFFFGVQMVNHQKKHQRVKSSFVEFLKFNLLVNRTGIRLLHFNPLGIKIPLGLIQSELQWPKNVSHIMAFLIEVARLLPFPPDPAVFEKKRTFKQTVADFNGLLGAKEQLRSHLYKNWKYRKTRRSWQPIHSHKSSLAVNSSKVSSGKILFF